MPIIKVTTADLLKTQNVKAGWYGFEVVKCHDPKKSSKGDSVNYVFDCRILEKNAAGIPQEKAGKEIAARFNSMLIGKMDPFYYSCTGAHITEEGVDTDTLLGKKFDGKVVQTNYEGTMYDNFEAFVPFGLSSDVPF